MQVHQQYTRLNAYHGPKRQILGNQAGQTPPAWRGNPLPGKKVAATTLSAVDKGSKILLSKLPVDVGENEVEILFTKTVGPVKDVFIVYNSQGKSKGMAVVSFQRASDAAVARSKYNGKIVDGRRPIKIEIVKDDDEAPQAPPKPPSLLDRIGQPAGRPAQPATLAVAPPAARPQKRPPTQPNALRAPPQPVAPRPPPALVKANPKARLRKKKGPKRTKMVQKSLAQLDQDMEEYRASADGS